MLLSVYVDDETFSILAEYSKRSGRSIDDLASAAVSEEARRTLPPLPRKPIAHSYHSRIKDGACTDCGQPKSDHR